MNDRAKIIGALALVIAMLPTTDAMADGRPDLVLHAIGAGHAQYEYKKLIVQFSSRASTEDHSKVRQNLGARFIRVIGDKKSKRLELIQLPESLTAATAIEQLRGDPRVDFAEPNWLYFHQAVADDPYSVNGTLWGMSGDLTTPPNKFGSQAGEAWANSKTDCSSVWVGIVDEGVMYTHADLAPNAATIPGEKQSNGIDDDANGYVDDVYGWDFVDNNNSVFDSVADDHGTHIAGTIGAVGNNGIGVAGVCWKINFITAKILGPYGGTTADAVEAIDYMTDLKIRHGVNLVATNNSWGGGGYSHALYEAIERANRADILFVTSAGNEQKNCDKAYDCFPAGYDNANIISVAGLSSSGGAYSLTSYGKAIVDIAAPAAGVISTAPRRSSRGRMVSGYASYSGTSMAAAHVTGAAALYKAQYPDASAAAIKAAILGAALPTNSVSGKTVTDGRLDVSDF